MPNPALIILGLDTGDPSLILRWAEDGTLPTIGDVLQRGVRARLTGPDTISPHGVWPSIWTGLPLQEHGRYLKSTLVPGTYELRAFDTVAPPAQPFWASLGAQRRRVVVIDPPGIGAVGGLKGAQVFDWGRDQACRKPCSEPPELIAEIRRRFGRPRMVDETQGTRWRDRRMYRRLHKRILSKGALALHLITAESPELIVVVFADTHPAGHRFRKYGTADGADAKGDGLGTALREIYRAVDRELGRIISAVPGPANVFIVSNGGITDGQPTWEFMDGFCHQLGYHAGVKPQSTWERVAAAPEHLARDLWRRTAARYLPGGWSTGDTLPTALDATDWKQTTAFALPSYYTGLVRVNLKGREPRGTVAPGADYEALLARLEADFRRLVHGKTGQPVVTAITRTAPLCGGVPSRQLPDLFVNWHIDPITRRIVHPETVLQCSGFGTPRTNYHARTGLVLAMGPGVAAHGALADMAPSDLSGVFVSLLSGVTACWPAARPAA